MYVVRLRDHTIHSYSFQMGLELKNSRSIGMSLDSLEGNKPVFHGMSQVVNPLTGATVPFQMAERHGLQMGVILTTYWNL